MVAGFHRQIERERIRIPELSVDTKLSSANGAFCGHRKNLRFAREKAAQNASLVRFTHPPAQIRGNLSPLHRRKTNCCLACHALA
jgi:hypothetical protein